MKENREKNGLTIHRIFWYFVLFSIVGLMIETIYCYVTTGVLESRKGLLYGPFCPVYGVGAALLILCLYSRREVSIPKLFFYGFLLGNVIEYLMSYVLEAMYGTRFWDYSYITLNLNGRVSVLYALFWGVLSIALMRVITPLLDRVIDWIQQKTHAIVEIALFVFFVLDTLVTVWAVSSYKERAMASYYEQKVEPKASIFQKIEDSFFSDAMMQKTFPNLRFIDNNGKEILIRDVLKSDLESK